MSKDTDKSLFIVSSVPQLYQQLLTGLSSHQRLAKTILGNIKTAYDFRRIEQVRELSRILIHIPIKEYQLIGEYYLIWCQCRESRFPIEPLEQIIGQTQTYKAQALLSRGTFEVYKGKPEAALYFYIEGLKTFHSVSDHIALSLAVAQLKSIEGFHNSALKDLENLIPIIKHAEPRLHYDFLNSYAVEIAEAGRIYEARKISRVVINSPFAFAYPEWQETANELNPVSRSFVAFKLSAYIPRKVLPMPEREHGKETKQEDSPARVMSLQKWKRKMAKKKKDDKEEKEIKDEKDMFFWIMEVFASDKTSDQERHKMYEAVRKIVAERNKPEPDDDDTEGA